MTLSTYLSRLSIVLLFCTDLILSLQHIMLATSWI